jgi:hypothetical protein
MEFIFKILIARMINYIKNCFKNFIKKYFYIFRVWDKFTPAVQIQQRHLLLYYKNCISENKPLNLADTGFKVFSQHEEDGLLLFIFAVIGIKHKTFVDIGSNDGVNSNCANFAVNFGWHGVFIDGDKTAIKRGLHFYKRYPDPWHYPPKFVCQKVTMENINEIITEAGFQGEIDLLSIDIDGNDYWIWDALEVISPRVIVVEANVELGYNNVIVPYNAAYSHLKRHPVYHGASPVAFNYLANKKGYKLVGANNYGHNMIFIKKELGYNYLPEVTVESILQHFSTIESFKEFEAVKNLDFIRG